MLVEITEEFKYASDGIRIVRLEPGDQPDLPPDIAKLVVALKKGKYVEKSQPMAPMNKMAEVPILKEESPVVEFTPDEPLKAITPDEERESLTVYQFAKELKVKFRNVIETAGKLKISASHGNSSLTPDEQDRIKAKL